MKLQKIKVLANISIPSDDGDVEYKEIWLRSEEIKYLDIPNNEVVIKESHIMNSDEECFCDLPSYEIIEIDWIDEE